MFPVTAVRSHNDPLSFQLLQGHAGGREGAAPQALVVLAWHKERTAGGDSWAAKQAWPSSQSIPPQLCSQACAPAEHLASTAGQDSSAHPCEVK